MVAIRMFLINLLLPSSVLKFICNVKNFWCGVIPMQLYSTLRRIWATAKLKADPYGTWIRAQQHLSNDKISKNTWAELGKRKSYENGRV